MGGFKNPITNNNFKEVISGSFASLITKAAGILLNYTLIYIITTKIGVDYVGFYNILLVFLLLTSILTSVGLNFSIIPLVHQFSASLKKLYTKSLGLIFGLLCIAVLLFYLFSNSISQYLFNTFDSSVYTIIFLMILYVFLFFNIEFIRANKKIVVSESLRNISFPLLILLSILLFDTHFENKFQLIISSILIASFCSLIPSFLFSVKSLKKPITVKNEEEISYQKMLTTSKPLMIMGLSSFFLSEGSLFILKYYFDNTAVGNFTIIYKISIIACLVFTISYAIVGPKISELFFNKNTKELRKTFMFSFKMIFLLSLPFFIAVLIFPEFFLNIFNLKSEFSLALIIMLTGQFVNGIAAIFGLFLMVTNKQKVYGNIYVIAAIVNIILGLILIPKYSVLGAAITVAFSYIFLNVICVYYVFKNKLLFN